MPRMKRRSQMESIDEINMTPLIDLTFLLLIIFMITMPLMQNGINVSPPEMDASEIVIDDNSLTVDLNNNGEIVIDKIEFTEETLITKLKGLYSVKSDMNIYIRGDGGRPYREVIELMKKVKKCGFKNINLITVAE